MTAAKSPQGARTRRTTIEAGDVLSLPQSNGKRTLAYVLALWPELEAVMTIALLSREVTEDSLRPEELARLMADEIAKRQLIAVVSTTTGTARVGEWPKIGAVPGIDVSGLLPAIPFRTGSIVGGKHQNALLVESLVEAYRGLVDWDKPLPGRPGYLKSLLFDSDSPTQRG